MEQAKYLSPWQTANRLGLTVSEFKGRIYRKLLPQPTRIISGRWNFDQNYVERVKADPKLRPYTRLDRMEAAVEKNEQSPRELLEQRSDNPTATDAL